jgi:hypothetical protein
MPGPQARAYRARVAAKKRQRGRHRRQRGSENWAKNAQPDGTASPAVPADGDEGRGWVDDGVNDYIAAIPDEFRPLFDRFHELILRARPDATVVLSYQMPSYKVDDHQLYLGIWEHGLSLYGWESDADDGFLERHQDLRTSTGTIRLRPADAEGISDDEILGLVRATLGTSTA